MLRTNGGFITPSPSPFVHVAEAAFIADLMGRQLNYVVDQRVLPAGLFEQRGNSRFLTRLGAAFAKFHFVTKNLLRVAVRRQILEELGARVSRLPRKEQALSLELLSAVSWIVERTCIEVNVLPFIQEAFNRAMEVDQAQRLVTSDPKILGGTPVFSGTRAAVEIVLRFLDTDIPPKRLKGSYPFLTEAHIQAARVYEKVHTFRG